MIEPNSDLPKRSFFNSIYENYKRINIYKQMIISLSILAIINSLKVNPQFLINPAISVISIIIFHNISGRIRKENSISYDSVIITGLLIGLILNPSNFYVLIFASFVAVAFKFIRVNKRHIFNPAMSGIFLSSILTTSYDSWWGASEIIILIILGLLISQKYRRFHLTLTFLATYFSFSILYRLISNLHPIYGDIFDGVFYFFAFFMLLEPNTSPRSRSARIVYAIISGALIFFVGLILPKYTLIGSLLILNLLVRPLETIFK